MKLRMWGEWSEYVELPSALFSRVCGSDVCWLHWQEYTREAILWKQLKHRNVLPFLGLYYLDKNKRRLCLVSPWMENGNLVQYLKKQRRNEPGGKPDRRKILLVRILVVLLQQKWL